MSVIETALYFSHPEAHVKTKGDEDKIVSRLRSVCREAGINLTVLPKGRVRYQDMPTLLSKYDLFIDHWMVPAYSKTALEAMCMGIPVIGYETPLRELRDKLIEAKNDPKRLIERGRMIVEEHNPEKVAQRLHRLYEEAVCRL